VCECLSRGCGWSVWRDDGGWLQSQGLRFVTPQVSVVREVLTHFSRTIELTVVDPVGGNVCGVRFVWWQSYSSRR
jgi:hypothetical protein